MGSKLFPDGIFGIVHGKGHLSQCLILWLALQYQHYSSSQKWKRDTCQSANSRTLSTVRSYKDLTVWGKKGRILFNGDMNMYS